MSAKCYWPLLSLLLVLGTSAGCGDRTYEITFEVADVINAWGDDTTQEQLDVDIVCLTKKDAEKHADIVGRTVRSDEWFTMRQQESAKITDIPAKQIYALRSGNRTDRDEKAGPPLLSAVNRVDRGRSTTVSVKHPEPGNDSAAIVIYGRFNGRTGMAKTDPVIIQPPPGTFDKAGIRIKVDRTGMTRVSP